MEGGGGGGILTFLAFFVVGYLAWFTFIGPDDPNSKNLFICPPPPLGNGKTYSVADMRKSSYEKICGSLSTDSTIHIPEIVHATATKPVKPIVRRANIRFEHRTSTMKEKDPKREYVSIAADSKNTEPVNVTGWRIGSAVSLQVYAIPAANRLPRPGSIGPEEAIVLGPGERLIVLTGRSPIGESFRTNICTGYLDQYQTFIPALQKSCPRVKDDLVETAETIRSLGDECFAVINRIGTCKAHSGSLPTPRYSEECQAYIRERANYSGCVDLYRNKENFFTREWRAYLGRDQEAWRNSREILQLYDPSGRVVDTITY